MLVGLVVERYDDELVIYCRSGDYRVSLPEFGAEFEVGTWVGVKVSDDEVEITGILNVDGLPEVRVVCGKAEVLTTGHIVDFFCETKDFHHIPILCRLPSNVDLSQYEIRIWARRLNYEERNIFQRVKWGVCEVVCSQYSDAVDALDEVEEQHSFNEVHTLCVPEHTFTYFQNKLLRYIPNSSEERKRLPCLDRPLTSPHNARENEGIRHGAVCIREVPILPKTFDRRRRQRVTALAMVILFDEKKRRHIVWLLQYHVEAVFYPDRNLQPGHFFQGRFAIGGSFKNKCHDYIQEIPRLIECYFETATNELELYVEALHKNRRNGACYEVFHNCLGYVRDGINILEPVENEVYVSIAVRRSLRADEDGEHVWEIVNLQGQQQFIQSYQGSY